MVSYRRARTLAETYAAAALAAQTEGNFKRAAFLYLWACGVLEGTFPVLDDDPADGFTEPPRGEPPRRAWATRFSADLPAEALERFSRRSV